MYPNGSHKYYRASHSENIYNLDILIHALIVFQVGIVLDWCVNFRNITIPEEESTNSSPNKRIILNIFE